MFIPCFSNIIVTSLDFLPNFNKIQASILRNKDYFVENLIVDNQDENKMNKTDDNSAFHYKLNIKCVL